jgi:hypothetical protein
MPLAKYIPQYLFDGLVVKADRMARACDHVRAAGDVLRQRAIPAR